MTDVSWRKLRVGLSTGGGVGLLLGITAPRNSYVGVGVLFLVVVTILVSILMLFVERTRAAGAVLWLSAGLTLATFWGVAVLRGM